jgi:CheY-like chemotaxis protein
MKALLVEDHAATRLLFETGLKRLGHQVVTAANGQEAWNLLHREQVDLVISDVMMPEMDGLELCRLIRSDPETKDFYIILLTAMSGQERYLKALEAGADDCMKKPFVWEAMQVHLRLAERILSLQAELRELKRR